MITTLRINKKQTSLNLQSSLYHADSKANMLQGTYTNINFAEIPVYSEHTLRWYASLHDSLKISLASKVKSYGGTAIDYTDLTLYETITIGQKKVPIWVSLNVENIIQRVTIVPKITGDHKFVPYWLVNNSNYKFDVGKNLKSLKELLSRLAVDPTLDCYFITFYAITDRGFHKGGIPFTALVNLTFPCFRLEETWVNVLNNYPNNCAFSDETGAMIYKFSSQFQGAYYALLGAAIVENLHWRDYIESNFVSLNHLKSPFANIENATPSFNNLLAEYIRLNPELCFGYRIWRHKMAAPMFYNNNNAVKEEIRFFQLKL